MSVIVNDVVLPLAHFTLEVSVAMTARTTALYGPSGAGKTSLLEVIAGLRKPQRGEVVIHDRVVSRHPERSEGSRRRRSFAVFAAQDDEINLPPRKRKVGYVPQDDALFPHLSVRQNITYGGAIDDAVISVLEIAHLLDRGVTQLSGGERKRVALARALLSHPEVLLLDEPLSGVDSELRARVLDHLVRVRDEFAIPTIYVTHDLAEASVICEEIVMMEKGRIMGTRLMT